MGFQEIDPEDLPEGLQEAIRGSLEKVMEEHEWFHAVDDAKRHQLMRWFEEQDKDQLLMLRHVLMMGTEEAAQPNFFVGIITYLLQSKFGLCAACGRNHDEEAEQEMKQMADESWPDFIARLPEETIGKLAAYQVELIPGEFPKVRCIKCGQEYPNLADRMLKPPDECPTCMQQSKWGGGPPSPPLTND